MHILRSATPVAVLAGATALAAATPALAAASPATPTRCAVYEALASGVNVRTAPELTAAVVTTTTLGEQFAGTCSTVAGASYTACGLTEARWVEIRAKGGWRFSVAACYTRIR